MDMEGSGASPAENVSEQDPKQIGILSEQKCQNRNGREARTADVVVRPVQPRAHGTHQKGTTWCPTGTYEGREERVDVSVKICARTV